MAKRKEEIHITYMGYNWLDVQMDDKFVDAVAQVEGVTRISPEWTGSRTVWIDPRYDAQEIIAEIKALADESMDEPSISDTAKELGIHAGRSHQIIFAVTELLDAAQEVYTPNIYNTTYDLILLEIVRQIVDRLSQGAYHKTDC